APDSCRPRRLAGNLRRRSFVQPPFRDSPASPARLERAATSTDWAPGRRERCVSRTPRFAFLLLSLAAVLLIASVRAPRAEGVFPDSPAGALAAAWFQAFNGSEADMRAMYTNRFAPGQRTTDERMAMWKQMRSDVVSLTPIRVLNESPAHIDVLAKN